ncbi:MAG: response regulator [Candidatus Thiothrix singaporensis]|uniref:Response regulator n=1 Tax=Candidatus Thiothrix singaporensis TaxID=2799669 RepID=A0A7L6AWM6_9GAMM|nr:MAG: response regulator [Candidatus Thiothrix singaporensis]
MLDQAIWIEIIRITPSLLWLLLACVALALVYEPVHAVFPPYGSAVRSANIDAALERFGRLLEQAVELARRNPQWQVEMAASDKESVMHRIRRNWDVLQGCRALVFDDKPETLLNEICMLQQLGIEVEAVSLSSEALARLKEAHFDLLISDIARPEGQSNGVVTLQTLHEHYPDLPAIFYIGNFNAEDGVPVGAFGITNRPDELMHLLLDVLERKRL